MASTQFDGVKSAVGLRRHREYQGQAWLGLGIGTFVSTGTPAFMALLDGTAETSSGVAFGLGILAALMCVTTGYFLYTAVEEPEVTQ